MNPGVVQIALTLQLIAEETVGDQSDVEATECLDRGLDHGRIRGKVIEVTSLRALHRSTDSGDERFELRGVAANEVQPVASRR